MKYIRYSRYSGEDMGIGAEELLKALSDFLLESGFNSQYMPFSEWNQHTLEELKKAIQQALEEGKLFENEQMEEMMQQLQQLSPEQMENLIEKLVQKMVDEGHAWEENKSAHQVRADRANLRAHLAATS